MAKDVTFLVLDMKAVGERLKKLELEIEKLKTK